MSDDGWSKALNDYYNRTHLNYNGRFIQVTPEDFAPQFVNKVTEVQPADWMVGLVQKTPGTTWQTKDSGERHVTDTGYQRDTERGKPRFDLLLADGVPYPEQMLTRVAGLLARGAAKYSERNWERADSEADLRRFRSSALRHLLQWVTGETDEDHAAAVIYNLIAHESTKYKMENE